MKKLLCLFLTLFVSSQIYTQEDFRNIFWLHGLNGEDWHWERYANQFGGVNGERQMQSTRGSFNSTRGVDAASIQYVFSNTQRDDRDLEDNIAVGHSLGGLVLQDIVRDDLMNLEGIITVGTPNQGAFVANNLNEGVVEQEVDFACKALSAGPGSHVLVFLGLGEFTSSLICDLYLEKSILKKLPSVNQTTEEVAVGSDYLNRLENDWNSNIEIISVVGEEDGPIHWNIAGSYIGFENNNIRAAAQHGMVEFGRSMTTLYEIRSFTNYTTGIAFGIASIFKPGLAFLSASYFEQGIQWGRGAKFLKNSEDRFNAIIGAHRWDVVTVEKKGLTSDCLQQIREAEANYDEADAVGDNDRAAGYLTEIQELENDPDCYEIYTTTTEKFIKEPSDAFIPASSQANPIGGAVRVIVAEGVNHVEELNTIHKTTRNNNDEMERVFNLIWEDERFVFLTDRR